MRIGEEPGVLRLAPVLEVREVGHEGRIVEMTVLSQPCAAREVRDEDMVTAVAQKVGWWAGSTCRRHDQHAQQRLSQSDEGISSAMAAASQHGSWQRSQAGESCNAADISIAGVCSQLM